MTNVKASGKNIIGDAMLECRIRVIENEINFKIIIASGIKCHVIKTVGSQAYYEEPGMMTMFRSQIQQAAEDCAEELFTEVQKYKKMNENIRFVQAKTIFMIDLDYDEELLKKRKMMLTKAFHPDNGGDEECMKKINDAYEILTGGKKYEIL